jgi:hypothetical protein
MKSFKDYLREQSEELITFAQLGIGDMYHRGSISSIEEVDPFRIASKQNKRGRSYGGFYVGSLDHAKMYPGNFLLKLKIDPSAKVLMVSGVGKTDRLDIDSLRLHMDKGVDIIWGKDIRGFEQGVIINKNIIKGVLIDNFSNQ